VSKNFGVTQKDIAEALNVSRVCVAIALNPKSKSREKLRPDTIARIEAKARELNYRPQRLARVLRSGRSHTIGVVCQTGIYHAPQERVRHLARGAIRAGYQLVSLDMDWFERDIDAAQEYLLGVAVEGIVFCNISNQDQLGWQKFIEERSLPVISINSGPDAVDQARADMYSAFRDMTLHHLEQGSRQVHLLLPFHWKSPGKDVPPLTPNQAARLKGYADAIRSVGGEVVADPIYRQYIGRATASGPRSAIRGEVHHPLRTELCEDVVDLGYYETKRLLQAPRNVPDSIICSNDHIAAGALAACGELGIPVPETVRISGADNAPVSRYRGVQLTTIEQPAQRMAQWSIERMVDLIENPGKRRSPKVEFFPCNLIFRSSTMPDPFTPPSQPPL